MSTPHAAHPTFTQTCVRLLLVTVASAAVFALLGGVVGLLIGVMVPEYYTTLFRNPSINAPLFGCVLGIGQGGALGVLAGLILAALLTWREIRIGRVGFVPPDA